MPAGSRTRTRTERVLGMVLAVSTCLAFSADFASFSAAIVSAVFVSPLSNVAAGSAGGGAASANCNTPSNATVSRAASPNPITLRRCNGSEKTFLFKALRRRLMLERLAMAMPVAGIDV